MYYVLVLFRKAFEVLLPEGVSFRPEPGSFGHVVVRAQQPMPSPEHGTTTTTALTLAQSALGDRDDGEEATRICQARPPGWRKKTSQTAKQALIEEATPGRVPVFAVRINYSITCITNCITICETLVLRIIQE